MIKLILSALLLPTAARGRRVTAFAVTSDQWTSIRRNIKRPKAAELVVRRHMAFLHAADIDHTMTLRDEDAVFLPADAPTVASMSAAPRARPVGHRPRLRDQESSAPCPRGYSARGGSPVSASRNATRSL